MADFAILVSALTPALHLIKLYRTAPLLTITSWNGYRIAEQHDSGVGLAGLRAGDIVTSVNGQAVGDVEQDRSLFDNVAASGLARVEVQRDGRTIVLSFPLQ